MINSLCSVRILLTLQAVLLILTLLLPFTAGAQEAPVDQTVQIWKDELNDKDPSRIQEAAYEIAKHSDEFVNDRQVIGKLAALLTDQHQPADVREVASYTLGCIGPTAADSAPQLIKSLRDSNPDIQRAAVEALGKIGPTGYPPLPLFERLMQASGPIEIKVSALEALARLLPPQDAIPSQH
jgi:HEAT repeats